MNLLLAISVTITAVLGGVASQAVALEALVGTTAILPCPSNDDTHRFQFWQLVGDEVIGPGNAINKEKYKYEVLTGTLYIRGVSTSETGFYKCVSKHISGIGLHIQSVELVVRKDWESEWESDHSTNVYRGFIAMVVILALLGIGVLLFVVYRRQSTVHRMRAMSVDEESADEGPIRGTYNATTVPSTSSHGIENPILDTDFPTMFKTLQTNN